MLASRARALMELGRADEALAVIAQAIELSPGASDIWHVRGILLRELGRMEDARAAMREALRLAPAASGVYHDLAQSQRLGRGDPLIDEMQRLVEDPSIRPEQELELRFGLGKAADDIDEPATAFAHWARGNALFRRLNPYDEAATLGEFAAVRDLFSPGYLGERREAGLRGARPIFVFGVPRSGTTLVEQILASHPETFAAGETDDFDHVVTRIELDGVAGFCFPDGATRLFAPHMAAIGGEYMRVARRKVSQIASSPASAEGSRAANSL